MAVEQGQGPRSATAGLCPFGGVQRDGGLKGGTEYPDGYVPLMCAANGRIAGAGPSNSAASSAGAAFGWAQHAQCAHDPEDGPGQQPPAPRSHGSPSHGLPAHHSGPEQPSRSAKVAPWTGASRNTTGASANTTAASAMATSWQSQIILMHIRLARFTTHSIRARVARVQEFSRHRQPVALV
jgi:hypothetical protein